MSQKQTVLILCSQNSCRSQMAEALLREMAGDYLDIRSAGIESSQVNPSAIKVLDEIGIDTSVLTSNALEEYLGHFPAYYLFIVCDAAAQKCPAVWPGVYERNVWPFDDPPKLAAAETDEEKALNHYRRVRDEIKDRLMAWLEEKNIPVKPINATA